MKATHLYRRQPCRIIGEYGAMSRIVLLAGPRFSHELWVHNEELSEIKGTNDVPKN